MNNKRGLEALSWVESDHYEWGDLARLVRKDRRPEAEAIIEGCLEGYRFLQGLTTDEAELATDPYLRQQDLFDKIAEGLS